MSLPTCSKCGRTIISESQRRGSYGSYVILYCLKCGKIHAAYAKN